MRRRIVVGLAAGLVLALGIDGSATSDAPQEGAAITRVVADAAEARLVGALALDSPDALFGGFSAISVGADGTSVTVLSDRGAYAQGRILRGADGKVVSLRLGPVTRLRGAKGDVLSGQSDDSEGLAIGADGRVFISFEGMTRVARFAPLTGRPVDLPENDAFALLPDNEGLEALAIDADGTLYTVPEALDGKTISVYRFRNGAWRTPLSLPRAGNFRPVAADFGPDGRFYLLERRFDGLGGFASRLRRFDLTAEGFANGVVLLQSPAGRHDNLEGLSVWRAPDGLRATMISDDNFFALQETEIVEYHLPD